MAHKQRRDILNQASSNFEITEADNIEPYFNAIPDDSETTIKFENGKRSEIVVKPVKFSEEDTK